MIKKFRVSELQLKMDEGDSCAMHIKLYMYIYQDLKNSCILASSKLHKTDVDSCSSIKWPVYFNSIDAALQQDAKCHAHSMVMHKSIK